MPKNVQAGSYSREYLGSKLNEIRNTSGYKHGEYYVWNDGGWYSDYCSSGHAGWQCHGYGINLFDWLFNQCAMCSGRVYDMSQVCVGDLIRYDNSPYGEHTIIVQDVVGDTVYFTDANGLGTGTVRWDQTFSKSYLQERLVYIAHASGNDIKSLTQYDEENPNISEAFVDIPSMGTSSYKVKAKASDNVGVTAVRFGTWTQTNGQDDIIWKDGTYNSSTGYWESYVYKSEHNNESDVYFTHIYAFDATGNQDGYGINIIPMGSKVNTSLGEFTARIVPKGNTNYAIGIDGTNVELETKNQSDSSQVWKFVKNSDSTYSIINVSTGKYLDIVNRTNEDRGNIQINSSNGDPAQKFYIMNYNDGYRIVASYSDNIKAVDLADASFTDGRNIQLHNCVSLTNTSQTWKIEKCATSISLNKTSMTMKTTDATQTLTATVYPTTAYNRAVTWSSSNTSVAKVSSSGVVTPVGKGTATITATTTDGTKLIKSCTVTVKNSDLPYTDVTYSDWFYSAVEFVHNNGYMSGTEKNKVFSPNAKITRGMMVTILYRMEGEPAVTGTTKFTDVTNSSVYYYNAVKWASDRSIVSGYDSGVFKPNDYITREQLAVMLSNYCRYKGKYKASSALLSNYADGAYVSSYAKSAMKWAVGNNVITGSNNYLKPQGTATRAETASMIYKYCSNIK